MKKIWIMLGFLLVFGFVFSPVLSADLGPKPSATIDVIGIDEDYELDILIPYRFSGAINDVDPNEAFTGTHYLEEDYFDHFSVLNGFIDADGYASATLYSGAPRYIERNDDQFELGYFGAPRDFKIAIMTESGQLIISEAIERQMFHAAFHYDLSGVDLSIDATGVGHLYEDVPIFTMIGQYLMRLILTIGLELLILFLFFYRLKESYFLVGIVNFFTQSFLTLFVIIGYYYWGGQIAALLILILGEIIVFTTESVIYILKLKEHSWFRALTYAIIANLATFILGFVLLLTLG